MYKWPLLSLSRGNQEGSLFSAPCYQFLPFNGTIVSFYLALGLLGLQGCTIAQEYCLVSVIILHSFVCRCIARKSYSSNLDMPPSIPHCPYWDPVLASDIR